MTVQAEPSRTIAAVVTEWRRNSHADVLLSRLLSHREWGHERAFGLRLASVYVDQFSRSDLSKTLCEAHGVPIFSTVRGAVGLGSATVPVDGVLVIGEHGNYPRNSRNQRLYPRRRLFEQVIDAFLALGRRVPVFSDKHLAYDWLSARWMYDLARHEGVPFMAGSSLPVAWRLPNLELPIGADVTEALALGYGPVEDYGFHALEALQCMVERRSGGETGVSAVQCLTGQNVWKELSAGQPPRALLEALEPARRLANPKAPPLAPRPNDVLFRLWYADGLVANVPMLGCVGECFAYAGRRRGVDDPETTVIDLEQERPHGHFGHLLRAIERMVVTGQPTYPVERTLWTTGVLVAMMQSLAEGGERIKTPHLTAIQYQPTHWPHAPGPRGSSA